MRKFLLLVIFLFFSEFISAQTNEEVAGIYGVTFDASNSTIVDTLTLHSDGTFFFHEFDKHDMGIPPGRNQYAKGTWKLENKIITFATSEVDFDEKHTLDFNTTKARFITKSPRDKSDRDIKTSIQFYESDIFWIPKRTFLKMN